MSDKHQIDKIFKKGLDGKGLEYHESEWAAMENILNSETSAKSGMNYIWMSAFIASIIMACLLIWPQLRSSQNRISSSQLKSTSNNSSEQVHADELTSANDNSEFIQVPSNEYAVSETDLSTHSIGNTITENQNENSYAEGSYSSSTTELMPVITHEVDIQVPIQNSDPEEQQQIKIEDNPSTVNYVVTVEQMSKTLSLQSNNTYSEEIPNPISFLSDPSKPTKVSSLRSGELSVYAEPFLEFINYAKVVPQDIRKFKEEQEEIINGSSIGFDVRFEKYNFSLITGASYSTFSEKTNYLESLTSYSYDTSLVLVDRNYTTRPDGSPVALIKEKIDSTASFSDTIACADCKTNFNYVTIPLAVRYDLHSSRFSHFVRAGLDFSFLSKASGMYSVRKNGLESGRNMDVSPLAAGGPENTMVSVRFTVGSQYRLTDKWAVAGSVSHSRSLNSQMISYQQQLNSMNFRLGLVWQLN